MARIASSQITITNVNDGKPTYIWTKYADSPISGMSDSGEGKQFMGMAFNKATPIASTNYNDYQWVFMPQNMQLGAKNLFVIDKAYIPSTDSFMKEKGSTVLQILGADPYNNPKNLQIGLDGIVFEPGIYALSGYLSFGTDGYLKYDDLDFQNNGDGKVISFYVNEETGYFEIIQEYNSHVTFPVNLRLKFGYYYNVFENIQFERGNIVTDYRLSEGDVLKWIKDTEDDLKDNIIQTQENKANIRINTDSITSEVSERIEMGNRLSSETSSLLEQHKEGFDFIISKIIDNQELTDGEVQSLRTWLTIDINGLMIGADGSQMTLHAMNDRIAFKENGVTISEWESGTMSVDNIIAKLSIVIGTHLIEKFLAPFGVTSLVRMVD